MHTPPDYTEICERFRVLAQHYCSVVDSASSIERADFALQIYQILSKLISEAVVLPAVQSRDEMPERTNKIRLRQGRMNDEQWGQLYNLLKEKLADWDLYWCVFDPIEDQEAIRGSLADDIADIYRDVKEGLVLLERHPVEIEMAIRNWHLLFHSHWGNHAMDVLRTIHSRLDLSFGPQT